MASIQAPSNSVLAPVADSERVFTGFSHTSLWFSLGVGLLVIQIGTYLVPAMGTQDALLAILLGFYFWFIDRRTDGFLPEDNLEGEISDRAGELGFFSPHSWWPLPVALSACTLGLGLLIGWWLVLIGLGALMISIIGMVTEYEKPLSYTSH